MLPPVVQALIRKTPTIAPVPHRAVLSVTGSQASEFLNGLVASSIPKSPQLHFFSAFLHAQGRIIHDAFFHAHVDSTTGAHGYLVEFDPRNGDPSLLNILKRHVLRSKVKIRDVSGEYDVWAAWGSEKETSWETQRKWSVAQSGVVEPVWDHEPSWPWGSEARVLRDRRAVGMGHRLLVKKDELPREASTHDVALEEDYLIHRIAHGVTEGSTDMEPMNSFPIDSNLDLMGGIDFRKGCYVGQELTVRTYHTGVIRKRVFPVTVETNHNAPTSIAPSVASQAGIRARLLQTNSEGSEPAPRPRGSGRILSAANGIALALLRTEHVVAAENGKAVLDLEPGGDETGSYVQAYRPEWWPNISGHLALKQ